MTVAVAQNSPARTPLYDWHAAHRGRLVEFAGWSMPVQYESIVAEHEAVRKRVGLFDVSHMGRLKFTGPSALAFLDSLLTRRVADLAAGQVRYSLMTKESGGILDDVLCYRLPCEAGDEHCLLVVNASNRRKIWDWVSTHLPSSGVEATDLTEQSCLIAVQGPAALKAVQPLTELPLAELKYYHAGPTKVCGQPALVSRTGYTGEDGVEIMAAADATLEIWEAILASGGALGAVPIGLGARDTLRLEAAMPLYGHELSETIDPLTAGLAFAVNLDGRQFPGHDALVRIKQQQPTRRRIGLELAGRRVPREQYPIRSGESSLGEVTSGTFSPTLGRPIAMGYVAVDAAAPGTELQVDIRGQLEPARVVKLPFYRRS